MLDEICNNNGKFISVYEHILTGNLYIHEEVINFDFKHDIKFRKFAS